jgi:hypothetical protein
MGRPFHREEHVGGSHPGGGKEKPKMNTLFTCNESRIL